MLIVIIGTTVHGWPVLPIVTTSTMTELGMAGVCVYGLCIVLEESNPHKPFQRMNLLNAKCPRRLSLHASMLDDMMIQYIWCINSIIPAML